MAGNLNIKNANGKTLTIQNPDTNNVDIVIDGSKIASTVSPVLTGNPVLPTGATGVTQAVGDNSTKLATTAFTTGQDIGVGQTWQDMTVSRAVGVTYTNTTGKPIMVIARGIGTSSDLLNIAVEVDGVAITRGINDSTLDVGREVEASAIIPNGSTYRITGTYQFGYTVFELR